MVLLLLSHPGPVMLVIHLKQFHSSPFNIPSIPCGHLVLFCSFKTSVPGTFLGVRWLRLPLPTQGVWFQSLVSELRCHMLCNQNKQTNQKKKKWKWPCNKFNKNLNKNIKKKTSTLDLLLSLLLVGDFNSVSPNFLLLPHIFLPASWLILSCFFEKKVKYPFLSGKFDGCYYQLFPFSIKPSFLKS